MNRLKLEEGQVLRILSITQDDIYIKYKKYWDNHLKRFFIYDGKLELWNVSNSKINPLHSNKFDFISPSEKYTLLVEHDGELKLIDVGRKIYEIFKNYINDSFNIFGLYDHSLNLHIHIRKTMGFDNYDGCVFTVTDNVKIHDYFETNEYKSLISDYHKHTGSLSLRNNLFMIEYLSIIGALKQQDPLIRLLKINKLKQKNEA